MTKIASAYSIFVGLSIFGLWTMLWILGEIPELETEPIRIGMHLVAEFVTAVLLIVGGVALLKSWKYGINLFQVSMGMLIYTLIQSPGYFAEQGEFAFVVMFAIFLLIAGTLLVWSLKKPEELKDGGKERRRCFPGDILFSNSCKIAGNQ